MKKKICVFCSSSNLIAPAYFNAAKEIGKLIGINGFDLVHGAGQVGLMGAVSMTAKEYGSRITGIIPEKLNIRGIVSEIDDELIITPDMTSRKARMWELSDAFIAMPGGYGSLDELFEILTLKQLDYHQKPVVILNIEGFYDHLLILINSLHEKKFIRHGDRQLFMVANNPEDAVRLLKV